MTGFDHLVTRIGRPQIEPRGPQLGQEAGHRLPDAQVAGRQVDGERQKGKLPDQPLPVGRGHQFLLLLQIFLKLLQRLRFREPSKLHPIAGCSASVR